MKSTLYLFAVLVSVQFGTSLVCLKCDNIHRTTDCNKVATCRHGETCFAEADANGNGYNLGCRNEQTCHNSSQPSCTGCCKTDVCNKDLCGIRGYANNHGQMCYGCDHLIEFEDCNKIMQCPDNQFCYTTIFEDAALGLNIHSHGCKAQKDCPASGNFGPKSCNACCKGNLCNNKSNNCTYSGTSIIKGEGHYVIVILMIGFRHICDHLRKPRVLPPICSLRTRKEQSGGRTIGM